MDHNIKIIQDVDFALSVMRSASKWMSINGKIVSNWWKLENLNKNFLLQYAKEEEFYVGLIDNNLVVAAILQTSQNAQDWKNIDKDKSKTALYVHWLCIYHRFSGNNLPKVMIDFAEQLAKDKNINLLRCDTNAEELKLREIYEQLGFKLIDIEQEDYRQTAFYEKEI